MPTEAEEIWRYSGIDAFDLGRFGLPEAGAPDGGRRGGGAVDDAPVVALDARLGLAARQELVATARRLADQLGDRTGLVVTVDGVVVAVEPTGSRWPDGVDCGGLADRPTAPEGLGAVAAVTDAFGQLHDACLADTAVIDIGAGVVVPAPVVVVHVMSGRRAGGEGSLGDDEAEAPAAFPRSLVRLGERAEAAVVEVLTTAPGALGGLVVPVAELDVADGARLRHAALQLLDGGAWQVAVSASRVGRDAELHSMAVASGGHYARLRTDAVAAGPGARCTLLAAFLGSGDQVLDFRTQQIHAAAHSQSELLFKGAVADRARSVYSGLIRIERGARGADARQTNHNLVLSEGARADSVPNLEIEENDVHCSHGSTVGPIDAEQRYYLESRGIEPAVAERLVVAGFFADLVGRSPVGAVGTWAEEHVEARLAGRMPVSVGAADA